jgi:hypothetical protein
MKQKLLLTTFYYDPATSLAEMQAWLAQLQSQSAGGSVTIYAAEDYAAPTSQVEIDLPNALGSLVETAPPANAAVEELVGLLFVPATLYIQTVGGPDDR